MSENSQLITSFIDAWKAMDLDAIMAFFTEDAEYINIPMDPPNRGKAEIRTFIEGFMGMATAIEFIVHNQIDSGNIVMNERTDRLHMNGNWVELQVMGVFEIEGDKIKGWRDYFDMAAFSGDA